MVGDPNENRGFDIDSVHGPTINKKQNERRLKVRIRDKQNVVESHRRPAESRTHKARVVCRIPPRYPNRITYAPP